uniref:SURF1-like protein n=1 Tax=Bracon brevicornis TaxID=1563983 RepID=A0A6V7HL48_9HYME
MSLARLTQLLKFRNVARHGLNLNETFSTNKLSKVYYHSSIQQRRYEEKQKEEKIDAIGWSLLLMPIGTFVLGTWQIQRRKWKLGLIEDIKNRITSAPVPLPEDLQELEKMEYMPVKIRGEFLYDKEIKIGPKSLIQDGAAVGEKTGGLMSSSTSTGYWIITPFKVSDRDTTILVNRGWVRGKRGRMTEKDLAHVPGEMEITGVVRLNETRPVFMPKNTPKSKLWVYRDIHSMAEATDSDPVFVDLVASDGFPGGPIAGQTRISFRNEHLSYIVTWYSLSLLTAIMWHRLYIKKLPLL